jgi:type IV secretory pathway VirB4 component
MWMVETKLKDGSFQIKKKRRKKQMPTKKKSIPSPVEIEKAQLKDFFDMISPSTIKFNPDYYICGDSYRSVWAIREYPPTTTDQAILCRFGDKESLTLHVYSRFVDANEQRKIIQNATRKNRMMTGGTDIQDTVTAEGNLEDVVELLSNMRRNKEPLLHCAVFLELTATSIEKLKELQSEVQMELARSKISIDRLTLRQKEGFLSVMPSGSNVFTKQFERVLPASSVANLYPFNYSGKTDPKGFYIGRDKFGTNILVDFDRRADDKTNANTLILGNSGQGKSYLMKLILTNLRESGKRIICLDAEAEYEDLTNNLGGCYLDLMSGKYLINPLEPKAWSDGVDNEEGEILPEAFRKVTRLSQHISYLKDFFRSYKDFSDRHIDTLEIMLMKLYACFNITDSTDYTRLSAKDYPTMSDLYDLIEKEYLSYDKEIKHLYTEDLLQELCLGLNSMCKGAESKYFNGHTNINDDKFLCFGVKGLMDTNKRLKDAMLFNILSFMSNELLTKGNTVASIDELYLFLTNLTAIEYIRNASKRVRKRDSAVILASQNIEDFLLPGIREYTKPLFSIPTHQFLFNAGNIDPKAYIETLQLEQSEFDLIKYPERGTCLYKCGNERYLLQVIAPGYKNELFGKVGGR